MRYITTSAEMQKIDQMTIQGIGIPGMVLMERAAYAMYEQIIERFPDCKTKICIVAGTGNNGGDGLALGRMLAEEGYSVTIQVVGNPLTASDQFMDQMQILLALGVVTVTEADYGEYDVLVDAIFGVGLSREVKGTYGEVIEQMNEARAYKIAVDIPSGVCATSGNVLGVALKCDLTVTFGLLKRGLVLYPGCQYAGEVITAKIGFPKKVIEQYRPTAYTYGEEDLEKLPVRRPDSNKGTYGKVLVVAGNINMAGACYFSSKAAYLCGSGLVQILTPEENRVILQSMIPEAILTTYKEKEDAKESLREAMKTCSSIVIGPGMGRTETTKELLELLLEEYEEKLIIDADGCNVLSELEPLLKMTKADVVLTPHMKEATRILNISMEELKENRFSIIEEYAKEHKLTFVLKDARTLISNGTDLTFINTSGNNGMSVGGSGDVLAGMIAGLCAGGMSGMEGAVLGVYCHGLSGDYAKLEKGVYSMMASDLLNHISDALYHPTYEMDNLGGEFS